MRFDDEVEKALVKVDEAANRGGLRDMRAGVLAWVLGALLAVLAAYAVFAVLEANRAGPKAEPAAKPVDVTIVPRQPARP